MAPGRFACAECSKAFSRYALYVSHVESPEHRKKAAARKVIEQLLDAADAVAAAAASGDGGSLLDVALERRRQSLLVGRTPNASGVPTETSDGAQYPQLEKDLGGANNCGSSSGTPSEEESEEPGCQSTEEEEVDLSCEYCGIALFRSLEFKVEHLETESHCDRKRRVVEHLDAIDCGQQLT